MNGSSEQLLTISALFSRTYRPAPDAAVLALRVEPTVLSEISCAFRKGFSGGTAAIEISASRKKKREKVPGSRVLSEGGGSFISASLFPIVARNDLCMRYGYTQRMRRYFSHIGVFTLFFRNDTQVSQGRQSCSFSEPDTGQDPKKVSHVIRILKART